MVHVVAYNAANTLSPVLSRIPVSLYNPANTLSQVLDRIPVELRPHLTEVCVFDDASKDDTFLVGKGYQATHEAPYLKVIRNPINRGYGGNQKLGYRYAIDHGFDVVVLLHGDGQYAPEKLPELLAPLVRDDADAVFMC